MKYQHFRKVETRGISLVLCQNWDRGERVVLPEAFGGRIYFAPLFVYRPGRGVALYFDFSDPRQDYDGSERYNFRHRTAVDAMLQRSENSAATLNEIA